MLPQINVGDGLLPVSQLDAFFGCLGEIVFKRLDTTTCRRDSSNLSAKSHQIAVILPLIQI
jgi:hypothetical protein